MFGFGRKKDEVQLTDLKKKNNKVIVLYKELKKEAKQNRLYIAIDAINNLNIDLDFHSVLIKSLSSHQIKDELRITEIIIESLLDAQELLRKGTEYGVQLALDRANELCKDRRVCKSAFLNEDYYIFEKNVWLITKMRELAYGEINRLKEKQDLITKTALTEKDSMMRVRYFEDIRVLEKNILSLEAEAHQYDVYQQALKNEKGLLNVVKKYNLTNEENINFEKFTEIINRYGGKN